MSTDKIINYRELIDRSTQGFVGRRWVREAVDAFLVAAGPRAFLLLGEPGSGRSILMTSLRLPCPALRLYERRII